MESIDSREIVLLVIAVYVAVMSLVRMMIEHRQLPGLAFRIEGNRFRACRRIKVVFANGLHTAAGVE